MTTPHSPVFSVIFGIILLMSTMYAAGRLHQWYRQNQDRDEAFREGYNSATESLFTLATRTNKAVQGKANVTEISDAPSTRRARHRAENTDGATVRLSPTDRGQQSA